MLERLLGCGPLSRIRPNEGLDEVLRFVIHVFPVAVVAGKRKTLVPKGGGIARSYNSIRATEHSSISSRVLDERNGL